MASLIPGTMGQFCLHHRPSSSIMPAWRRRSNSSDSSTSTNASTSSQSSCKSEAQKPKAKWEQTKNWRVSAVPKALGSEKPSFEELKIGHVLYLDKEPTPKHSILYKHNGVSDSDPWGHPAVVCKKWENDGEQFVEFRLCTSFHGQRLELSRNGHDWRYYLMANNHSDVVLPKNNTQLATLENGGKFRARTYINLSPNSRYPIEYKYLKVWGDNSMRFDQKTTDRIIDASSLYFFS